MIYAHSLAGPSLHEHPLLGPVLPMRWMSNLFRLAYLDEADRHSVAHGRDPRHQAEIRRLRRMSMAPAAGRYYPVDDSDPDDFLNPEEARQLVELWRSRQTARALEDDPDFDVVFSATSPLAPHPSPLHPVVDPDDDESSATSPLTPGPSPLESDDVDADEWSEYAHAIGRRNRGRSRASPPFTSLFHHPRTNDLEEPERLPNRALQFAAFVSVMLITALLGIAAAWFVHDYLRSPPPQPAEEVMLDTTKIVASAVPRGSPDVEHPVLNPAEEPERNRRERLTSGPYPLTFGLVFD